MPRQGTRLRPGARGRRGDTGGRDPLLRRRGARPLPGRKAERRRSGARAGPAAGDDRRAARSRRPRSRAFPTSRTSPARTRSRSVSRPTRASSQPRRPSSRISTSTTRSHTRSPRGSTSARRSSKGFSRSAPSASVSSASPRCSTRRRRRSSARRRSAAALRATAGSSPSSPFADQPAPRRLCFTARTSGRRVGRRAHTEQVLAGEEEDATGGSHRRPCRPDGVGHADRRRHDPPRTCAVRPTATWHPALAVGALGLAASAGWLVLGVYIDAVTR